MWFGEVQTDELSGVDHLQAFRRLMKRVLRYNLVVTAIAREMIV